MYKLKIAKPQEPLFSAVLQFAVFRSHSSNYSARNDALRQCSFHVLHVEGDNTFNGSEQVMMP